MDFNPRHEKWQCCCCRVTSGLSILGIVEMAVASLIFIFTTAKLASSQGEVDHIEFHISLMILSLLISITSLLMVIGIHQRRERFMFPTLAVRALVVVFATVFGISMCVVRTDENDDDHESLEKVRLASSRRNYFHKATTTTTATPATFNEFNNNVEQPEPSEALRLVFVTLIIMVISVGVFFTTFLIVKCIHFIRGQNWLRQRRNTILMAGQIDPYQLRKC